MGGAASDAPRACAGLQEVYEQVPAAKALFDRASELLGYDLLQVCVEGAPPRPPPSRYF